MIEIPIGCWIYIIGVILYLSLFYYVLFPTCCANERTLTTSSDVETLEVLLQPITVNSPNTTLPDGVTIQIAEDKVNQIQEENLDDNNNSSFPVTTSLRNGPCYGPLCQDYAGKPLYWYRSSFHHLIDIYNV